MSEINVILMQLLPMAGVIRFCRLIEEQETQPDLWFRERCSVMWRENKLAVSEFLGSNPDNLVFVHNTTTGAGGHLLSSLCYG